MPDTRTIRTADPPIDSPNPPTNLPPALFAVGAVQVLVRAQAARVDSVAIAAPDFFFSFLLFTICVSGGGVSGSERGIDGDMVHALRAHPNTTTFFLLYPPPSFCVANVRRGQ